MGWISSTIVVLFCCLAMVAASELNPNNYTGYCENGKNPYYKHVSCVQLDPDQMKANRLFGFDVTDKNVKKDWTVAVPGTNEQTLHLSCYRHHNGHKEIELWLGTGLINGGSAAFFPTSNDIDKLDSGRVDLYKFHRNDNADVTKWVDDLTISYHPTWRLYSWLMYDVTCLKWKHDYGAQSYRIIIGTNEDPWTTHTKGRNRLVIAYGLHGKYWGVHEMHSGNSRVARWQVNRAKSIIYLDRQQQNRYEKGHHQVEKDRTNMRYPRW